MKNIINKMKTLNKKTKIMISISALCIVTLGVVSFIYVMNNGNENDKIAEKEKSSTKNDTVSLKDNKKSKEDTKTDQEETSNSSVEANTAEEQVSSSTDVTVNNDPVANANGNNSTNGNTNNNTTTTQPPAQVCSGVYLDPNSVGNSGLVFYSNAEMDTFSNFWENDPDGFLNKYGHESWQGHSPNAVDSCGNQVSIPGWWTIIWLD